MLKGTESPAHRELKIYNNAWARLLWIERGCRRDDDIVRIRNDFLDARRTIGFIVADWVLVNFLEGLHVEIPDYCYEYLSCLSVDEYKEVKSYTIWESRGKIIDDNRHRMCGDYFEACSFLPQKGHMKHTRRRLASRELHGYLNACATVDKEKITRRKAYWCYLAARGGGDTNYRAAEHYVEQFYGYIPRVLRGDDHEENPGGDPFDLVHGSHYMANMFEVCLLLYVEPRT